MTVSIDCLEVAVCLDLRRSPPKPLAFRLANDVIDFIRRMNAAFLQARLANASISEQDSRTCLLPLPIVAALSSRLALVTAIPADRIFCMLLAKARGINECAAATLPAD